MGSSASIHTLEVSFVNPKTGNLLPDNEIKKLNETVKVFLILVIIFIKVTMIQLFMLN